MMIIFERVSKYYGAQAALKNVSLEILPKDFVVLIGSTGSGKSTFLKMIMRDVAPSKGRVLIDGVDSSTLKESQIPYLRRKIGVIFQDFKLLQNKSVRENVSFALEVAGVPGKKIRNHVGEMLEMVGLEHKSDSRVTNLSGGERQRVAIARALIHRPKLLLADEPTGNIDPISTKEIVNLLLDINSKGTTVVLATHNVSVVKVVKGRVIALDRGEIISDTSNSDKYIIERNEKPAQTN